MNADRGRDKRKRAEDEEVGEGNEERPPCQSMDDDLQLQHWSGNSTWDALGGGVLGSSDTCECSSEPAPMPRDLFVGGQVSVWFFLFTMHNIYKRSSGVRIMLIMKKKMKKL